MNKTYSWQGGTSTAFGTAANWFDVTDGTTAASPPGAGDSIELSGTGTIDGMASGLAELTVSGTTGAGYAIGATLGVSGIVVEGALALTDGSALSADMLDISGGTLAMQDGSFLQAAGQTLDIFVSGSGAAASIMQIAQGAFLNVGVGTVDVGIGAAQAGTLLITGGTLFGNFAFADPAPMLEIGVQGGTGDVAVSGGGTLLLQGEVDVGLSGQGLLDLGAGSQLTAFGTNGSPALVLGGTAAGSTVAGQGTLVSFGATIITSGDVLIGDTGQGDFIAGGGTFTSSGITLGLAAGSAGTLSIGANETWDAGFVVIGDAGSGNLQMTATAAGSGSGTIGYLSLGTAGGSGTLAISHETLYLQDFSDVGRGGGTNSIVIGAGGVWDGAGQTLFLEPVAAGDGNTLSVAGAGAVFDAGSLLGFAASQIRFGAGAQSTIGTDSTTDGFGAVGGTITIDGADLTIGAFTEIRAAGTLSITGSSVFTATGGLVLDDALSTFAVDGGVTSLSSTSGTAATLIGGTLAVAGAVLNIVGGVLLAGGTLTAESGATITCSATTGDAVMVDAGVLSDSADLTGARWKVDGNMRLLGGVTSLRAGTALSVTGTLDLGQTSQPSLPYASGNLSETGSSVTASDVLVQSGTLSVGAGSTLLTGGSVGGAVFSVVDGSVIVDGGSALVEGQAETSGTLTVSGGGTLSVTDRGTASAGAALTLQGGLLLVTGAHTAVRLGGALLDTPSSGDGGSVVVSAGAQVAVGSTAPATQPGFVIDGPITSTATVDGAGTVLRETGQMLLGVTGAGTLTVSNGSELDVASASGQALPSVVIESANHLISMASVTGGAHWSIAGGLDVAPAGFANLAVSGSGTVSAGSVTVGGAGSNHGSLSLAGNGDVLMTQLLTIGAAGTVTLGAGSHLSAGGLSLGMVGQGVATHSVATLDIAGGTVSVFGGAVVHGGVVLSLGGTLAVSNGLTLGAGSTIIGQGVLGAGNIVDLGRIVCNGGTMTCLGPVNGTGLLSVANGDIVLAHGEAATVGLVFGANGTFTAAGVGLISGTITGWTTGDSLDFTGVHVASDSLSGHVLTLFDGAGTVLGRETFAGNLTSSNFSLSADHGAGTLLSFHV